MTIPARLYNLTSWVTMVNFFMVALLAYSFAQLTWKVMPQKEPEVRAVSDSNIKPVFRASTTTSSVEQIDRLHLFGVVTKTAPLTLVAIEAPDTRLNLTLHGIVNTGEPGTSFAIIADSSKTEKHYRIDDAIPGGATLKEIHTDRVILQRAGRFETLRLPVESATTSSPEKSGATKSSNSYQPRSTALSRQIKQYRDRIMKNPLEAWKMVEVQPVSEGGKLTGYRVNPKRDQRLFRQAGLQQGDVVTQVNGIALDDPAKIGQVISQLSNARRLELQIMRGGSLQSVVVDIGR
jgi:general secretion pathway protein C